MKQHNGFTLMEMLVVIMIITMLAAFMLSALSSARNVAAAARTRATITKINRVVMKRYASYRNRKVYVDTSKCKNPRDAAQRRLNALRILMRQEMPDRYSDLELRDDDNNPTPALTQSYIAHCAKRTPADNRDYMAAELLYMQIMADPVGAGMFSESEIGDFDADGLPEFIDGWGKPIRYLLWPAGFFADEGAESDLQITAAVANKDFVHDPFDTAMLEPGTPALYPLIYSAGPDGMYDINFGKNGTGDGATTTSYSKPLEPYEFTDGNNHKVGLPLNDIDSSKELHHYDNITNHTLLSK